MRSFPTVLSVGVVNKHRYFIVTWDLQIILPTLKAVNEYIQGLIQFDYVILSHVCSNCVQIDNSDILTIFFILRETF